MILLVVLPIAFAIAFLFDKKFEDTIALSMFIITTVLYISGLITTFTPGMYFVFALAIICTIYCLARCLIVRDIKPRSIVSDGFLGFGFLTLYFFVFSYGRYLQEYDDFIHWGIAVKHFYILSDFSNVPYTTDLGAEYPPFIPLWSFFSTKLWITCSTGMMLFGELILIAACAVQMFDGLKKDKKYLFPLIILFLLTVPFWMGPRFGLEFYEVRPDIIMGFLLFYILYNYEKYYDTKDLFYLFSSIYGSVFMVLTKRPGIIVVCLALLAIMFANIKVGTKVSVNIKVIIGFTLSFTAAYASWALYVYDYYGAHPLMQYLDVAAVFLVPSLIIAGGMVVIVVLVLANKNIRALLVEKYMKARQSIPFSIFSAIIVVLIGIFLRSTANISNVEWKDIFNFFLNSEINYIGYLIHLPLYLFIIGLLIFFEKKIMLSDRVGISQYLFRYIVIGFVIYSMIETWNKAVYLDWYVDHFLLLQRYLSQYFIGILLYGFWVVLKVANNKKQYIYILMTILVFSNCSRVITDLVDKSEARIFRNIEDVDFAYGDKVFYMDIDPDEDRGELDFYYQIAPADMNFDIYENSWYANNDYSNRRLTIDEVSNMLVGYNYVYLRRIDDGFKEYYSDLFENSGDISEQHLYKVISDESKISLQLCR